MANRVVLKTPAELAIMRESGRIVAETLALLAEQVRPGVTTGELDKLAYEHITKRGAVPSFKGYQGFPASICASVNEEVVHGIPGKRALQAGDLFSIDVGAFYRGFHGDSAITVPVGTITPEAQRLLDVAWQALEVGVAMARPGVRLGDLGAAIQEVIESAGYGVVRDLSGHGVGRRMHEAPSVLNYGERGRGMKLEPGMVIAIEPMLTAGAYLTRTLDDNWTIVTLDKSLAAHVEHTVAVTNNGPEILTRL
jgi:methionyl aminopeptidase